jgi:hypothetical protein
MNVINSVANKVNLAANFFIGKSEQDDNQGDRCGNLSSKSSTGGKLLFNFANVVFVYCLVAVLLLKRS